jgi:hypothetical protein
MSSSWPILLGVFALVVAAFWYDATNASASASAHAAAAAVTDKAPAASDQEVP